MNQNKFIVKCSRIGKRASYNVGFPYNQQLVERIKNQPKDKRKWDGDKKVWEIHALSLYKLIISYKGSDVIFFDFGGQNPKNEFLSIVNKEIEKERKKQKEKEDLEKTKQEWVEYKKYLETNDNYKKDYDKLHGLLKESKFQMFPHQVIGCMYTNKVRSVLLTHDMGTGKTLTSILFCELNNLNKVVVVTPNSLKFNYHEEVKKFTNSKSYVVNGKNNEHTIEESKYIIINYDYFNSKDKKRADYKWKKLNLNKIDGLVFDECQNIKNSKSNTYKNIKRIFKDKIFNPESMVDGRTNRIYMSGTPAPNRAYELYNILNQISPIDFPTKTEFYEYYCGMTYDLENGWGYVVDQENQKFEELYEKISPYVHRVKRLDVLKDLPPKHSQKVYMEMDQNSRNTYEHIKEQTSHLIPKDFRPHHFSVLSELRVFLSNEKAKSVHQLIDNVIENNNKIVFVDFYIEPLKMIYEKYKDIAVLHTGQQTPDERNDAVRIFQDKNSNKKLFLGQETLTKEGLTLTAANVMIINRIPFTPGITDQISDRICRIGQEKNVLILFPVFYNTMDDEVFDLSDDKESEISMVIDGEKKVSEKQKNILDNIVKYFGK